MKWLKQCLVVGFLFLVLGGFLYGLEISERSSREEEINRIQTSVEKAAVQCYAMQGTYPKSLTALLDQYTLHINEEDYQVYYDYNGGNIMPSIHVIRKE